MAAQMVAAREPSGHSFSVEGSDYLVDLVQYQPTDRPIEDRWSFNVDIAHTRLVLGVYDGHGGSETADVISHRLPNALLDTQPSSHSKVFERVDEALIEAFVKDHTLFGAKSKEWIANAKAARAGCMALVFDLDLTTGIATISNAGDCRLAVARQSAPGVTATNTEEAGADAYPDIATVVYETVDLNAKAPSEQDRLRAEHPGEDMLIVSGRLFGRLMSTRAFGDAYYKLPISRPLGKYMHKRYIDALSETESPGKVPMNQQYESYFYGYRTPPYITARPVTHTLQIHDNDLVIVASDGLWDRLSSIDVMRSACRAISAGAHNNVARCILQDVLDKHPPGDDTTIVVLRRTGTRDGSHSIFDSRGE